ncbi:hypothetical protein RHS01_10349 [Rhizoctonia solani]|uniref:Uncharacterized protein n=1 Tax=Rhizoctonia solani TaxID=456999 RepID=A0A8H7I209_9AGAM|nr:hypothetical protein RHS01_10349 [Rhizoctonia solani]
MPHPLPKAKPIGLASGTSFWPEQPKGLPTFAQPMPQRALPLQVPSPPLSLRLQSPIGAPAPPPPAPTTHYPAPVKVDHPNAYTGGPILPPDEHEGLSQGMGPPTSGPAWVTPGHNPNGQGFQTGVLGSIWQP